MNSATLSSILKDSSGLVFGDVHDSPLSIKTLTYILPELKENAVKRLYLEMLPYSENDSLQLYQKNKIEKQEMANKIASYWQNFYQDCHKNIIELIDSCKKIGIEVIGIDIKTSTMDRINSANKNWGQIISENENNKSGKYIIFCGALHTEKYNLYSQEGDWDRAKGIDSILNIKTVTFGERWASGNHDEKLIREGQDGLQEGDYVFVVPRIEKKSISRILE